MSPQVDLDEVCLPCRAGLHEECTVGFAGELDGECCCNGSYDRRFHIAAVRKAEKALGLADAEEPAGKAGGPQAVEAAGPIRGDSGYIHPEAWPSARDIGTLTAVGTTGRKRVAKMYPISGGQVCEWARQKNCGGGVNPIVGCLGNPASELHHGPDKNTLNNEKGSRGIGINENVHVICSFCHNEWHAKNDPTYPPYDRDEQQSQPWLPLSSEPWGGHQPVPATLEELMQEEVRRDAGAAKRGKGTRGRNSQPREAGDHSIDDEPDEE